MSLISIYGYEDVGVYANSLSCAIKLQKILNTDMISPESRKIKKECFCYFKDLDEEIKNELHEYIEKIAIYISSKRYNNEKIGNTLIAAIIDYMQDLLHNKSLCSYNISKTHLQCVITHNPLIYNYYSECFASNHFMINLNTYKKAC